MSLSESQLSRLKSQLESIKFILSVTSTTDLLKQPPSGKWSPHEQICHIARVQDIFFARFEKILAERQPPKINPYRAEDDPDWKMFSQKSTHAAIDHAFAKRKELTDFLEAVKSGDLKRKGIHPALGELTLETWIEFFLVHEGFHLYRLMSLLKY